MMPQPEKGMDKELTRTFKLTVIRHGETYGNRDRILQGQKDYCLSDVGVAQARQLASRAGGLGVTAVFSSDLSRAYQTAELMVEGLGVEVQQEPLLRERCFGEYEGRPSTEIKMAAEEAGLSLVEFHPRGGESLGQTQHRANLFCDYLCQAVGRGWSLQDLPTSSIWESYISLGQPPPINGYPSPPPIGPLISEPSPLTTPPAHAPLPHPPQFTNGMESVPSPTCSVPVALSPRPCLGETPHFVAVTHGGFMRCLFKHFHDKHKCRNLPIKGVETTPPNTSINSFLITTGWCPAPSGLGGGEWKVLGMDCTALHDVLHHQQQHHRQQQQQQQQQQQHTEQHVVVASHA